MKYFYFRTHITVLFFLLFQYGVFCQIQIDSLAELNFPLLECSGLTNIDGHFVAHNDSGDDANLYEINGLTGTITRQVLVNNVTHIDWEDICHDEDYIYISDSGNNNGTRTNLKIHKVLIDDFFNTTDETVEAETIYYAYADQTDFSGEVSNHNFDCEAIVSIGDSLYLFTKNRGDFRSNVYPVSKNPGDYLLVKTDSIEPLGLITGATYLADSAKVILTGYTFTEAFLMELSDLENTNFSSTTQHKVSIPLEGSYQVESIEWKEGLDYLITSEGNSFGPPALYCVQFDINTTTKHVLFDDNIHFYPNPCQNYFNIKSPFTTSIELYDGLGKLVLKSLQKKINVSHLKQGHYSLIIKDTKGIILQNSLLVINRN